MPQADQAGVTGVLSHLVESRTLPPLGHVVKQPGPGTGASFFKISLRPEEKEPQEDLKAIVLGDTVFYY